MGRNLFLALALLLATPLAAFAQTYPAPSRPVDNTVVAPCIQSGAYASCLPSDFVVGASGSGTAFTWSGLQTFNAATTFGSTITTPLTGAGAQCLEANSSGVIIGTGAICGGSGSVPAGSSGVLQYNNSGAFGGAANLSYLSAGTLYSAVLAAPALAINSSGSAYGQIGNLNTTQFGLCANTSQTVLGNCPLTWQNGGTGAGTNGGTIDINGVLIVNTNGNPVLTGFMSGSSTGSIIGMTTGNAFTFGTSGNVGLCYAGTPNIVEVDEGTCGGTLGILNAGTLHSSVVTATTTLNAPDGGKWNAANGLQVGSNTSAVSGMVFQAANPSALPTPPVTTNGAGVIGIQSTGVALGPSGGYAYPGLVIQGWPSPETPTCTSFCTGFTISFMDNAGNIIGGILGDLGGNPLPFEMGDGRTITPTAANEGYPLGQLFMGDYAAGTIEGPLIITQPQQGNGSIAFIGLGRESPTDNNWFFGSSGNFISPWNTASGVQPDVDTLGCWGVGVAAGTASGGIPATYINAKLCATSGGPVEVMNAAKNAAAPFFASFYRTTPVTVSGLSTADPSPSDGDSAYVTDATSCTFNGSLTGSGSTHCRVHYDGSASAWKGG